MRMPGQYVNHNFGWRIMHHKAKLTVQFDLKIVPSKSYTFISSVSKTDFSIIINHFWKDCNY